MAPRKSSASNDKPKTRRRRKKPKELTPEQIEAQEKLKKALRKKGVWEVTLDNGFVLGLFEGTPQKIGAYVAAQQEEVPHAMYFQLTKIRTVPDEISKDRCCDRRFQRKDNFCPVCGAARTVQGVIPDSVEVEVYTETG